jgi:multidrug resistance efflux pump
MRNISALLNRIVLFGTGLGLLIWGITLLWQRMAAVTTTEAFINGRITTVRAPIDGVVRQLQVPQTGTLVETNQVLLNVVDPLANSQDVQQRLSDLELAQTRLETLNQKLQQETPTYDPRKQELLLNINDLSLRTQLQQKQLSLDVILARNKVEQAQLDLQIAQKQEELARSKYEKYKKLADSGAVPRVSMEEAYNEWKVKSLQAKKTKVALKTAESELAAKQQLRGETSTIAQKRLSLLRSRQQQQVPSDLQQENKRRRQNLTLEKQEVMARINTLRQEIELARQVARNRTRDRVEAPKRGVVWEILAQEGERVSANQPLMEVLDCSSLWVEAFVTIDDLKRFQIGSPVEVKLQYRQEQLQGEVKTIRSYLAGGSDLGKDVAVQPPDFKRQQLVQVRIELQERGQQLQKLPGNPLPTETNIPTRPNFCNVGQLVKVEITPTRQWKQQQSFWFSIF